MAEPKIKKLTDFLKIRRVYEKKAVDRMPERLDAGMSDVGWDERVRDEIEIDLLETVGSLSARLKVLEEMILDVPELKG